VRELEIGSDFAGHRIEALVGRGGMALVYRATQLELNRPVALKLIAPQLAEDREFRTRFKRESHIAASIDHPNVVPIFHAGEADGQLYITMRFVDGTDLRERLADGRRLTPQGAVRIVAQVAAALDAAHARGLVHRDVKPANILITGAEGSEHAYLADFGLSNDTVIDERGPTVTGQRGRRAGGAALARCRRAAELRLAMARAARGTHPPAAGASRRRRRCDLACRWPRR
jgi:serine/threonine protein kinase